MVPAGLRNSLLAQESSVWGRGSSSKATATHSAYRAVTAFESTWNEVTLCDPALLDRHTLSGDVAVGTVTQILGRTRVSLTNTPRFNESALWAVIDGHRHKVARHAMLVEDDTTLAMVLDVPQRAQAPMERARQDRLPVVLYPQRFTMPAATPRTDNPWLTHPETPWTPREVPADVLIAGLPD